jgi:hypothetical protein
MVRKISTSQLRSQLRRLESKQRTAINNYNRAIKNYNTQVRKINNELRRNQQKIKSELSKLNSGLRITTTYSTSVRTLNVSYQRVTDNYEVLENTNSKQEQLYDLIEQENANNLVVANTLNNPNDTAEIEGSLNDSMIGDKLKILSPDLNDRWNGALYSLNPKNPDATRHFCTSSREIFTDIFDNYAHDEEVFNMFPNCDKTERGNATRRWKIKYFLNKKGIELKGAEEFIDNDIDNILELYHILSDGTHGYAGRYTFIQLKAIKKRVEDGILFLCNIVS